MQDGIRFGQVLEQIPSAKHHRALESFKASNPDRWPEMVRGALTAGSSKWCRELASLLIQGGKMELLKETLARLISQHTAGSELLLWLGRDRNDSFVDILGPEVFRAMLTAMERDQFNEKRSNRLREFILDDQELLGELTASADIEVIKDLTRALQLSTVFDDTQIGQTIESKQVTEIPLNGRSYTDLLAVQARVAPITTSGVGNSTSGGGFGTVPVAGEQNTGQFSIHGQIGRAS